MTNGISPTFAIVFLQLYASLAVSKKKSSEANFMTTPSDFEKNLWNGNDDILCSLISRIFTKINERQ